MKDTRSTTSLRTFAIASVAFAAWAIPAPAAAHVHLTSPESRHAQNATGDPQKSGPCGEGGSTDVRGTNVVTYKPGQTIDVVWEETITHPGHFRILFDKDGQDFPNPTSATDYDAGGAEMTLADNIPKDPSGKYKKTVTLPNVECSNCTLQLMQIMTDKPPFTSDSASNDFYYHCVDVVLTNGTIDAGAGTVDAGAAKDAGATKDAGDDEDDDTTDATTSKGGCATTPAGTLGGFAGTCALVAAFAVTSVLRRRAKRRATRRS
ncbi:MAG: SCE4755 family polysaccharide monooxygenase-like protein [Polyangiaceae bacterium]